MNHHSPIAVEGLPSIAVPAVFAIIALAFGWRIPAVIQIAGFIARRIDCWVAQGMCIQKGERLGLIRFGSRVEVFLPYDTHIIVSAGDKVMGGETPIVELLSSVGMPLEKDRMPCGHGLNATSIGFAIGMLPHIRLCRELSLGVLTEAAQTRSVSNGNLSLFSLVFSWVSLRFILSALGVVN